MKLGKSMANPIFYNILRFSVSAKTPDSVRLSTDLITGKNQQLHTLSNTGNIIGLYYLVNNNLKKHL